MQPYCDGSEEEYPPGPGEQFLQLDLSCQTSILNLSHYISQRQDWNSGFWSVHHMDFIPFWNTSWFDISISGFWEGTESVQQILDFGHISHQIYKYEILDSEIFLWNLSNKQDQSNQLINLRNQFKSIKSINKDCGSD